ncbi:MAG: DUF6290 family protein [Clostridia bacterium]|nr:DUF6290 family protein [Clostridia bacterium]MDO5303383.1 DUF6290 family protein [Clostridia bacterium]
MSTISVRVPDDELAIFKSYAQLHNASLSSIIRDVMMEHIENEYDLAVFTEYEKEKTDGTLKNQPITELWKELDL